MMLENRGQRSEVRGRRSEVRGQRTTDRCRQPSPRSGQAAIEFVAGLLLLLILLTGLIHVNRLARTSLFLHSVLRGMAGEQAMKNDLSTVTDYISGWETGPDGLRYTADDQPVRNSAQLSATLNALSAYSVRSPDDWSHIANDSRLPVSQSRLQASPLMPTVLGFVHAEETYHVPVDPVIRQLVYGKDEVAIKEEVWMPLMGGLY